MVDGNDHKKVFTLLALGGNAAFILLSLLGMIFALLLNIQLKGSCSSAVVLSHIM